MIRRKRIQAREEEGERGEAPREGWQRRKESAGRVSRFNYAIGSAPNEEGEEHSNSRGRGFREYRILSGENQSSVNNKPLQHNPTRLLKKDYLYGRSIESQNCRQVLGSKNFNTSFDNCSGHCLGEREEFRNCSFESTKNSSNCREQGFISGSYLKRTAIFADAAYPYLDLSSQSLQKSRNSLQKTRTEEDLQVKYEQIYAINQREKQKSASQGLNIPPANLSETVIINARPHIQRKSTVLREQARSISKAEASSGSNTQRNANRSSAKKLVLARGLQTRKTSPTRNDECRATHVSELVTLRSSPARYSAASRHIDCNLRLIDEFSQRISWKIEEVTSSLHSLRLIK